MKVQRDFTDIPIPGMPGPPVPEDEVPATRPRRPRKATSPAGAPEQVQGQMSLDDALADDNLEAA
jgi:hypothetical protein